MWSALLATAATLVALAHAECEADVELERDDVCWPLWLQWKLCTFLHFNAIQCFCLFLASKLWVMSLLWVKCFLFCLMSLWGVRSSNSFRTALNTISEYNNTYYHIYIYEPSWVVGATNFCKNTWPILLCTRQSRAACAFLRPCRLCDSKGPQSWIAKGHIVAECCWYIYKMLWVLCKYTIINSVIHLKNLGLRLPLVFPWAWERGSSGSDSDPTWCTVGGWRPAADGSSVLWILRWNVKIAETYPLVN